jgi:signal transduction histidine kinase/ligand-binding sensor domain-containing protein
MRSLSRPTVAVPLLAVLALGTSPAGADPIGPIDRELGDYRMAQWTTAQGLPQNTVTDMVFLPDGELWLATFGGLARFDGHVFRVLDMASDEGLPANRIVSLAAVGSDSFLFLTQQGHLGRVAAGRATLLVPPPAASVEALELLVDRAGRVFCRSADGRAWQSDGRSVWRPVAGSHGHLHAFALDEKGEAWGIRGDHFARMTGGPSEVPLTRPEEQVVVATRSEGGFWLGLERGVGRFVGGRMERLRVLPSIDRRVFAVEPAGDDVLWTATDSDVSCLDREADGSWRRTSLPLGRPGALSVRSLRLDAEGSLWIGTAGGGLFRVNRLPTRLFGAESGLADIAALAPDGDGGAFVASGCRALFHLDRSGTARPLGLPDTSPGRPLPPCGISLAPGPADTTWVRAGHRLFRVRGLEVQVVASSIPLDEGPIVPNPDDSVWVVSRSGSVQLLSARGELDREVRLPAPLMSASLGPDGTLWVGGDGEVFRVGPAAVDRIGATANAPRGLVRDVLAEPDGTTWIGTYGGGVGRLRAGHVERLTVTHGLPDNSVSRILEDGRGRLWISTNRGVAVIARSELEAVADGRAPAFVPVVLGTERGVPEANFGSPAGFADAGGRLWFGTIEGAVSIDAAAFPFNTTPPAVRVEEVRAGDEPLPLGPTVRIPPRTARLRVSYTALSLLYPEQLRFRFRVEGVDAGWVDAGAEHTVDWSPPGPGRYRFLVEARNEDGVWSSAPAVVVLDVRPAWWQTTAFRLAGSLAGALLALAVVWQRIRGIERRHATQVRVLEEQRQAEERLASLRAQLEHVSRVALAGELAASLAHEVRQPIGAIVNNAEAGRRNLPRYLEQPAELEQIFRDIVADGLRVSEVVRGLRGFLGAAGPETGAVDLSSLVREMLPLVRRELEDNRVRVDLALAESLPAVEALRVQLGQVVVNLVLNACEALAEKDGERRVTISTAARDGHVELAVRDNGPGLGPGVADRVFEPFVTTKPGGLGVGLAICRSIAERHGGHLNADTPPGGGLRMTLTLPASRPRGA